MSVKLCPKIIFEGTRLTLKTRIAFALNEHPLIVGERRYRSHSPIISAEWFSFSSAPGARGLINFNADEENQAMETYRTWVRLFELQRGDPWIIDRFHISTIDYQDHHEGRRYDFQWLEKRLLPLGFQIVLCTRTAESFVAAREERMKFSGNVSLYGDLQMFVDEQKRLRDLVHRSILPFIEIDVSDNHVPNAIGRMGTWMESLNTVKEEQTTGSLLKKGGE